MDIVQFRAELMERVQQLSQELADIPGPQKVAFMSADEIQNISKSLEEFSNKVNKMMIRDIQIGYEHASEGLVSKLYDHLLDQIRTKFA